MPGSCGRDCPGSTRAGKILNDSHGHMGNWTKIFNWNQLEMDQNCNLAHDLDRSAISPKFMVTFQIAASADLKIVRIGKIVRTLSGPQIRPLHTRSLSRMNYLRESSRVRPGCGPPVSTDGRDHDNIFETKIRQSKLLKFPSGGDRTWLKK